MLALANSSDVDVAEQMCLEDSSLVDSIIDEIIKTKPIILNRAPTLHKLSMLSFKCVIIDEKVIRLHPLVCSGFNADFDGDQMAVHVPLSEEACSEAQDLLMATRNVLHPASGLPSILPNQDMVLGLYYASIVAEKDGVIEHFDSYADVQAALTAGRIALHTRIKFPFNRNDKLRIATTTPGRLLISRLIPQECEIIFTASMPDLTKENLYELIEFVAETCGIEQMALFCEKLMA